MKTAFKIVFLFGLLLTFSACNLNEVLSKEVEINDKVVEFDLGANGQLNVAPMSKVSTEATEVTLLDKTYDVNVNAKLAEFGLSTKLIKAFAITHAKLEVTIPTDVTDDVAFMEGFKNLKVYFKDKTKLVAKISGSPTVSNKIGLVTITIVDGDLLNMLNNESLHVIITGDKFPGKTSHCKFTSSYKIKAGLLK